MEFAEMEKINVTQHIKQKGKYSYLSWPYAVSEFRKACPNGAWKISHDGHKPYLTGDKGCYVEIDIYPDVNNDLCFTQVHPVIDNRNNTILEPNAFQINTSIQRCLVKAIAICTGIGLHIYAGEDLPPDSPKEKDDKDNFQLKPEPIPPEKKAESFKAIIRDAPGMPELATWFKSKWPEIKDLPEDIRDEVIKAKDMKKAEFEYTETPNPEANQEVI